MGAGDTGEGEGVRDVREECEGECEGECERECEGRV